MNDQTIRYNLLTYNRLNGDTELHFSYDCNQQAYISHSKLTKYKFVIRYKSLQIVANMDFHYSQTKLKSQYHLLTGYLYVHFPYVPSIPDEEI